MQIKVYNQDGITEVSVIDPSDGAVTHNADLEDGQTITIAATSARSPADIEFGGIEAIPGPEPTVEESNAADGEADAAASEPEDIFGGNGEEPDEQGSDPDPEDDAA